MSTTSPFPRGPLLPPSAKLIASTSPLISCLAKTQMRSTWAVKSARFIRLVLQEGERVHAVLAILLAFTTQARKKSSQKGEESPYDRVRRLSSPRSWDVALVPPGDFAPLPTRTETGLACNVGWAFPPSL